MKFAAWLLTMSTIALSQGISQDDPFKPLSIEVEPPVLTSFEMNLFEKFEHTLFGGRRINPGELIPAVSISNCSAFVVGPETLLTAGHCRSTGSTATFTMNGKRYTGKCTQHEKYSQGRWLNNDFALCSISPKLVLPVYGSLEKKTLRAGDTIIMNGFGRGSNGYLNVGSGPIMRVESWQYLTRSRSGLFLGAGDSGGALLDGGEGVDLKKGPFRIVGINSRGSSSSSFFNRTDIPASQDWFHAYAKAKNVEICGINKDCSKEDDDNPPSELCDDELAVLKSVMEDLIYVTDKYQACLDSK